MAKIKIVIDTNVFLSAIFFKGIPAVVVRLGEAKVIQIITSKPLLDELEDKLTDKFNQPPSMTKKVIKRIKKQASLVKISGKTKFSVKDPKNHMVVETALKGKAKFVVSGDHHLKELKEYKGIKFINPSDFIKKIKIKT